MGVPKNIEESKRGVRKDILNYKKKGINYERLVIDVDGNCIGFVIIHSLDRKSLSEKGAIGVVGLGLLLEFRGRGIGSRALKLLTNYSFKKFKLKRITG